LVSGGALNPSLDWGAVEAGYRRTGVAYLDGLLSPEALRGLQRFCLEPTIWFDVNFVDEVSSKLSTGFCCPLLLQIAWELREALPEVLGKHLFRSCWSYKYFHEHSDAELHTDDGAVSVNLWITPDECNLEPGSGGLVLWNKRVLESHFQTNVQQQRQHAQTLINRPDARSEYVAYGCNRALLFDSNVLHKTHTQRFAEGYANRRVNVTFLYGRAGIQVRGVGQDANSR
jgi:hypothetical protein